jgi:hypothetical protein
VDRLSLPCLDVYLLPYLGELGCGSGFDASRVLRSPLLPCPVTMKYRTIDAKVAGLGRSQLSSSLLYISSFACIALHLVCHGRQDERVKTGRQQDHGTLTGDPPNRCLDTSLSLHGTAHPPESYRPEVLASQASKSG